MVTTALMVPNSCTIGVSVSSFEQALNNNVIATKILNLFIIRGFSIYIKKGMGVNGTKGYSNLSGSFFNLTSLYGIAEINIRITNIIALFFIVIG